MGTGARQRRTCGGLCATANGSETVRVAWLRSAAQPSTTANRRRAGHRSNMISDHYLHTGQRTCHADDGRVVPCRGSGQDAAFAVGMAWPQPRFESHDDEVVDRLTGLVWCRNANLAEFPLTWQEALDFVATMNGEQRFGRRDWRLPNRRELRSLLSLQNNCLRCRSGIRSSMCSTAGIGPRPRRPSVRRTPGTLHSMAGACFTAARINPSCCGRCAAKAGA